MSKRAVEPQGSTEVGQITQSAVHSVSTNSQTFLNSDGVGLRRHTMLWWETQSKSRVLCFNFLISLRVWLVDFSNSWTSVVFQGVVWNKRSVSSD